MIKPLISKLFSLIFLLILIKTNALGNNFLFDKNGNFSTFEDAGPPLGIMAKTKYNETVVKFEDSSMYIFTDGITEIKDTSSEMLGSEGFQNYIKKYQEIPNNERLKEIINDILKTGYIQKDDLTIVGIDGL